MTAKTQGVLLEITKVSENGHVEIRAFPPQKVTGSLAN